VAGILGGKPAELKQIFLGGDKMMPWYPYWNPWGYGYPGYGMPPYGYPGAPMPKEQEIAMLEEQARALESELASVRGRLEELRK
jgi:hypothetical protein